MEEEGGGAREEERRGEEEDEEGEDDDEYDNELLEDMQSPISRRKEISPELDDIEEVYFEAFQDYRQTEVFNAFTNYDAYKEEALVLNSSKAMLVNR